MNKIKLPRLLILLLSFILCNCSGVPLSFSIKDFDSRLLGLWCNSDYSLIYNISQTSKGIFLQIGKYNPTTNIYDVDSDAPMYFTNISEKGNTTKFFDIEDNEKGSISYLNAKFDFISPDALCYQEIESYDKQFKNSKDFKDYVQKNINNPEIFSEKKYLTRVNRDDFLRHLNAIEKKEEVTEKSIGQRFLEGFLQGMSGSSSPDEHEESCGKCDGTGKIGINNPSTGSYDYVTCNQCNGTGRVKKYY